MYEYMTFWKTMILDKNWTLSYNCVKLEHCYIKIFKRSNLLNIECYEFGKHESVRANLKLAILYSCSNETDLDFHVHLVEKKL